MSEPGRPPDFKLGAMDVRTGKRLNDCGAGWVEKDESISIVLDPFVQLNNNDGNLRLRLFPVKEPR
jgi:hypothetical protein